MFVKSYQEEQKLIGRGNAGYQIATVASTHTDGLSLIFPGQSEGTKKHFARNNNVTFSAGNRVKVVRTGGTYFVESVISSTGIYVPEDYNNIDYSWKDIAHMSANGEAQEYLAKYDRKPIDVDGVNYEVEIVDFGHDDLAEGSGKAGITFALVEPLETTYSMNTSATNAGSWRDCSIRATLQGEIFGKLPADLQAAIRPVIKLTSAGGRSTDIIQTEDTLFLASEVEIFGDVSGSVPGEGMHYSRFSDAIRRTKKRNGAGVSWSLRSPSKNYSNYYNGVTSQGARTSTLSASSKYSVIFFFSI